MRFKLLTNIDTMYRQVRIYAIIFAILCLCITGYSVYASYSFAEAQRQKIYVLDQGKSLMLALSQDASLNRPVEIREHVRRFHELLFTLSPEKAAIESNINRALSLADESGYKVYKDLLEQGYYNRIISSNATQRVDIDSLQTDFDVYPYRVKLFGKLRIIRASNITIRSIVTLQELENTVRSDLNPGGLLIEKFTILENRELETVKR